MSSIFSTGQWIKNIANESRWQIFIWRRFPVNGIGQLLSPMTRRGRAWYTAVCEQVLIKIKEFYNQYTGSEWAGCKLVPKQRKFHLYD